MNPHIRIIECEQNSPEWIAARLGVPTASCFSDILAKGEGKTRRKYMRRLAGERITGKAEPSFKNGHMDRGHEMEPEVRSAVAAIMDYDLQRVGFIVNVRHGFAVGCSPDALVGDDGIVEIKTKIPSEHIEVLELDRVPPEHIAQIQGALWVCERQWVDFVSYWPGLRPYVKRVYRDETYIATLKVAVQDFCFELDQLQQRIAA